MAYASVKYMSDGITLSYPYNFEGGNYIRKSDIQVIVNGEDQTDRHTVEEGVVTLSEVVLKGYAIEIKRVMPKTVPYAVLMKGADFTEKPINLTAKQQMFMCHEALDTAKEAKEIIAKAELLEYKVIPIISIEAQTEVWYTDYDVERVISLHIEGVLQQVGTSYIIHDNHIEIPSIPAGLLIEVTVGQDPNVTPSANTQVVLDLAEQVRGYEYSYDYTIMRMTWLDQKYSSLVDKTEEVIEKEEQQARDLGSMWTVVNKRTGTLNDIEARLQAIEAQLGIS